MSHWAVKILCLLINVLVFSLTFGWAVVFYIIDLPRRLKSIKSLTVYKLYVNQTLESESVWLVQLAVGLSEILQMADGRPSAWPSFNWVVVFIFLRGGVDHTQSQSNVSLFARGDVICLDD